MIDFPRRQRRDDVVDLLLGAHVDAARRLIHDDDLGLAFHGLAKHQLLLIAAGELPDTNARIPRPDIEAAHSPIESLTRSRYR